LQILGHFAEYNASDWIITDHVIMLNKSYRGTK